jgi:hypothetical protein
MVGIFLGYLGVFLGYGRDMIGIFWGYSWSIHEVIMRDMVGI